VENNKKSPSNYGFDGLIQIFHQQEIDIKDWIIEPIDKERGGMEFMLPNAEGKIYLGWSDLYHVDIDFVNSKKNFTSQVTLGELDQILVLLEEQRQSFKKTMANMLKEAFSKSEEE